MLLMWLLNIKRYGQLAIILILVAFSFTQTTRLRLSEARNIRCQQFMEAYKLEGEREEKLVKKAEREAEAWHAKFMEESEVYANLEFPADCEGIRKLAIEVAQKLKRE